MSKDSLKQSQKFKKSLSGDETKQQAYEILKERFARPYIGTDRYEKIIKQITEYLEL